VLWKESLINTDGQQRHFQEYFSLFQGRIQDFKLGGGGGGNEIHAPCACEQKLPDNREYIKIQRMAFKTILCTKKYLTSHSLKIPIVI
jgi:hypothetical protein